ncbi:Venom carboxylesterase-6 [Blattella germanica]|nr:Venom carboxylesterase-6 [Blattella germanica]
MQQMQPNYISWENTWIPHMQLLAGCAYLLLLHLCSGEEVTTAEGKVRGTTLSTHAGRTIHAFLGIPYAKPPTGSLRFKPPQTPDHWDDVKDATKEGSRCPQLSYPERNYQGSEDCLYLNVFTPRLPNETNEATSLLDVVVVLHGGGFTHGSGDVAMYGPDHLLDHDIIMVTANYRLGALGNYGLKDQVDVLRWVRRNIPRFLGNPNRVTLFGVQAGGASVHYHLLSGLSRKLFHRAVSQSGTALSPWAQVDADTARERAIKLGNEVGCTEPSKLINCLRKVPTRDLVQASTKVQKRLTDFVYPFVPVTEEVVAKNQKALLPNTPVNLMKKPLPGFWEIPWLVGVTSHEGLPQSLQVMVFPDLLEGLDSDPIKNVLKYLNLDVQPEEKAEQVAKKIWEFYFKNETITYGNLVKLAEMTSDYNYYHGLANSVKAMVEGSDVPIFVYHFSYNRHDLHISLGVPQGEDTLYIFPDIIEGGKFIVDEEHFHITEKLLRIISNFARHGDPTPEPSTELGALEWPLATAEDMEYVDIGNELTVKNEFYSERIAFWESIFNILAEGKTTPKDEL